MAVHDLRLIASTLLLAFMAVTLLTGFVADALDLNRFVYHRYPAYLSAGLLAAHVALNWQAFRARWATRLRSSGAGPMAPERSGESIFPRDVRTPRAATGSVRRQLLLATAGGAAGLLAGWLTSPKPWLSASLGGDVGTLYHNWSKPSYAGLLAGVFASSGGLGGSGAHRDEIPLPRDFSDRGLSLEEAIDQRRSLRSYSRAPMPLLQLSRLLHRAGGITDPGYGYRAAPSAGALYPLEIYAVANRVEGLAAGVYRYAPRRHSLESIRTGDFGRQLLVVALGQDMVLRAPVVLVLSAVFERTRQKYRERSYRYILMECGHVAQNVYLATTSMGLGTCAIGAFLDDELNGLLGVDGEQEAALYIMSVGAL